MARIKIEITGNEMGTFTIPIRITDINYGNHVGNDAFVGIIHEARMQWLQQNGYTEMNFAGAGLIMSDLAIEFKKETFYGDALIVKLYATEISKVSFDLLYEMLVMSEQNSVLVAKAKTGMVCFDYEQKKRISLTEKGRSILLNRL